MSPTPQKHVPWKKVQFGSSHEFLKYYCLSMILLTKYKNCPYPRSFTHYTNS